MKVKYLLQFAGLCPALYIVSCTAPMPMEFGANEAQPLTVKQQVESVEKRNRPGLGTGWGDKVESSISYTKFSREGTKPKSLNVIYYNDREGIEAMTQSWNYSGAGMQKCENGLVEWGVKSRWGYAKNVNSEGKRFIIGKDNSQYSLVINNVCRSRLEVVLSVDGLDVMDGKSASTKKRGYIISPSQTLVVKGFRTRIQPGSAPI